MIPTSRQVALWTLPLVLAVLAIGVRSLVAVMVAFDLALLVVLVLDAARSRVDLQVRRDVGAVAAVGVAHPVKVVVDNPGRAAVGVRITDEAPGAVQGLPVDVLLAGQGRLEADYRVVVPTRGHHVFGGVVVRVRSPWGLWERQRTFEVPSDLRVYPDFRQLRAKGVNTRLDDRRAPVRTRRVAGGENEFQRLRPYVAGDPYRHIDWKATARKQRPITREFGQESNQNVLFLLDAGRMMSAPMAGTSAFDHALHASLLLGQAALKRGDRVGLLAFDRRVRTWVPPKGGRRSSSRLIHATYDLQPSLNETDFAAAYRHLAVQVRRRSLVVVFTSVVDGENLASMQRLVRGLHKRHLPLVVWIRDPALDAVLEDDDRDPHARGAAAELALARREALQSLQRGGAVVVDAPVAELTGALLARYVEIKARRLL